MNQSIKFSITIIFFVVFNNIVYCQQLFLPSQYMYSSYSYNPSVAGTLGMPMLTMLYKQLWTGINNSPKEQFIFFHFPISKEVGIGSKLLNISTGPFSKNVFEATYSYRFRMNHRDLFLSLGLSALLYECKLNKELITLENPNDNILLQMSNNLITPDVNCGSFLYNEKLNIGFSINQILNRKVSMMNKNLEQRQQRHYFISGSYKFKIPTNIEIEPNLLIKFIEVGIIQADISISAVYNDLCSFGLGYRTNDALVILLSARTKQLMFGYAYDIILNEINKYCLGSHEIMLRYKFKVKGDNNKFIAF